MTRKYSIFSNIDDASKAAIALGITSEAEYRKGYKMNPKLPAHPSRVYSHEWDSWMVFLGTGTTKYSTYVAASIASSALGIKSAAEYRLRHHEDAKLPLNPLRKYATKWGGWLHFLGVNNGKYLTLKEASTAARKLKIKTYSEYIQRYSADHRLPYSPKMKYHREWVDWNYFLGIKKAIKYSTLADASAATAVLGIKTAKEYKVRYKEDPMLVSNPSRTYVNEWSGAPDFFGRKKTYYATKTQASKASIELGIFSSCSYFDKYKSDPQLPSDPIRVYRSEWVGWREFLGLRAKVEKYKTLSEASRATQKLGISSQSQYFNRHKEDERLPASPYSFYKCEWTSWFDFLGREKNPYYETLEEASVAAKKLCITTARMYEKKYRQDPKLHSVPSCHYSDWTGWKKFLGTDLIRYTTIELATSASKKLGICSVKDYNRKYKADPLLPSNPYKRYKDSWQGWNDFLDIPQQYETYEEASIAAIELGITSATEYGIMHKNDPRLYALPRSAYKADWTNWDSFLKTGPKYPISKEWSGAIDLYLSERNSAESKQATIRKFYFHYYNDVKPTEYPSEILHIENKFNAGKYEKFVLSHRDRVQRQVHSQMCDFFNWMLTEYCIDEGESVHEDILLPGFRNPIIALLGDFSEELPKVPHFYESNKPVLPLSKVDQARKYLFPNCVDSFRDAVHLHRMFESDWVDINREMLDESDLDCVWRKSPCRPNTFQIWSPVRAIALFTLLRVPLRGQQILWLDSGEADAEIPNRLKCGGIEWGQNKKSIVRIKMPPKGFISQCTAGEGMRINTSKTSNGGYVVPYIPHELAELVIRCRNWQTKYNPIEQLTKWTDMKLSVSKNIKILKARGSQAFLFRKPRSLKGEPYMTSAVFARYLPALLFAIQNNEENIAWKEGNWFKSKYTPHSLRVSLITAYVVDGGVPISVISKLVGHSSIVMTIYYTKIGHGRMKVELDRAEKLALVNSVARLEDLILNDGIEKAKGELFSRDSGFLGSVEDSWPKSSFQITDKGICAMGGGGCDLGGMDDYGVATNGPVVVGYLGKRNCVRCRYFITGPAFVGGLAALCNEVLLETNMLSRDMAKLEKKGSDLKDEKYDEEKAGRSFTRSCELRRNEADYENKVMQLDVMLSDFVATQSLITQCRTVLANSVSQKNKQLIVADTLFDVTYELEDTATDFRLLCEICDNATIYTSSSAARAIPRRSQMLDRLSTANGFAPVMFNLSEEEQLAVGNQAAQLIKSYVSRWSDVDRLLEGDFRMDDILLQKSDGRLHEKFERLVTSAEKFALIGGDRGE